jgi:RNA polymerase sigma-70 factor (ECF subfamily)
MKRPVSSVLSIGKAKTLSDRFRSEMLALLPRLRRFAAGLARDPARADDLCQMTVERALRSRDQWQAGTRMDSWMYRIMRNLWIDETRAANRRGQTFVDEEAGAAVGADGGQEARAMLTDVDRAMARLPDDQREAVLLVMVEGWSYKEAADIVGCPVGTLNSRLVAGATPCSPCWEKRHDHHPEMIAAYADGELEGAERSRGAGAGARPRARPPGGRAPRLESAAFRPFRPDSRRAAARGADARGAGTAGSRSPFARCRAQGTRRVGVERHAIALGLGRRAALAASLALAVVLNRPAANGGPGYADGNWRRRSTRSFPETRRRARRCA